jgi:hypothetical protein
MNVVTLQRGVDGREHPVVGRMRLRDRLAVRLHRLELDRRLAAGEAPDADPALLRRAQRSLGTARRRALARQLRGVVHHARATPPGRARLDRAAVLGSAADIEGLARRLLAPVPVTARGVAGVGLLLTDGAGPLYRPAGSGTLRAAVGQAAAALDP